MDLPIPHAPNDGPALPPHPPHPFLNKTTPNRMLKIHSTETISPSELLRRKHQHLQSISNLASQFGGKLVDVSENSVIVELAGKTSRVEAFLKLVQPFGVLESARTGARWFCFLFCFLPFLTNPFSSFVRAHGHAAYPYFRGRRRNGKARIRCGRRNSTSTRLMLLLNRTLYILLLRD